MATIVATDSKTYPCGKCSCDAEGRHPDPTYRWSIPGILDQSPICPSKLAKPASWFWIDLYRHYKNGILPLAGGLLDQPNSFIRAMSTIDYWSSKNGQ